MAPATSPSTAALPASSSPASTQPQSSSPPLPKRPQPKAKITLPAKLGAVTLDHKKHAEVMAIPCARCHHASRPEKPLVAEQQACRECHTTPATAPLKTNLQAAFHDPKAAAGTCLDCHREALAKGKPAPVKCMECHKKG